MKVFSLIALMLAGFGNPAQAQDSAGPICNPAGNQAEMNQCAIGDYKRADSALNDAYALRMKALDPAHRKILRTEQRAWLARRDASCKREAKKSEGGSIWQIEYFGCLERATAKRTKQLVDGGTKHPQ